MEEHTKKLLLYGGGGASLLLLILYMKNKGNAQAAAGFAPGPGTGSAAGGGTSNDALAAAQINAATQLEIARGNQALQASTIAAQTGIAQSQIAGALKVADINATSARTNTIVSAAVSTGGVGALKLLIDAFTKWFSPSTYTAGIERSGNEQVGSNPFPESDQYKGNSFASLGSSFVDPATYDYNGAFKSFSYDPGADSYRGSTGSGDASWFGTSPGENQPVSSSYVNPYQFDPSQGIPTGYQD